MRKPKITKITDYDLCRVGTVARSDSFTPKQLSSYLRKDARPMIKRMLREGMLERVSHGRYFPTQVGWRDIKNACEGMRRIYSAMAGYEAGPCVRNSPYDK